MSKQEYERNSNGSRNSSRGITLQEIQKEARAHPNSVYVIVNMGKSLYIQESDDSVKSSLQIYEGVIAIGGGDTKIGLRTSGISKISITRDKEDRKSTRLNSSHVS